MKLLVLFLLAFVCSLDVDGQNRQKERCASSIDYDKFQKHNPSLFNYLKEIDRKAAEYTQKKNDDPSPNSIPNTATVVTIPVVVHVIHNGQAVGVGRNISDAQIRSQIDVLNQDFRRLNADRTNTPAEFAGVAADVGIEFRLACVDPNGNPTDGIRRVQGDQDNYNLVYNLDGTVNDPATGLKANDAAWNRDRYLNIWSANIDGGNSTLGYATLPGAAANIDGVVIQFNAFGRTGNLQAKYDKGRTGTHEVGHWLSLIHIWGNDNVACTGTDNVADTPNQGGPTSYCPSGQMFSCGSSDMYQNYMDYTNDACMNLFTSGQGDRMKVLFYPATLGMVLYLGQISVVVPPSAIITTILTRLLAAVVHSTGLYPVTCRLYLDRVRARLQLPKYSMARRLYPLEIKKCVQLALS